MTKDLENEIGKRVDSRLRNKTTLAERREEQADKIARRKAERVLEHSMDGFLAPMSFVAAVSVGLGAYHLLPGDGFWHYASTALYAGLTGFLSFMCNKQLFHKASTAVASGCIGSTITSASYLAVMIVMVGSLGFTGMSFHGVEADKRREPLAELQRGQNLANKSSIGASAVGPVVDGIATWAVATASAEETGGAVSGRRGAGPVTRRLRAMASQIRRVSSTFGGGDKNRVAIANKLQNLASEYERVLNEGGASKSSRADLVKIYSRAQRLLTELENAVPLTALRSLVGQLRSMDVPAARKGRMDVKASLLSHADRLEEALRGVEKTSVTLAAFPKPTGVAEGWKHIDRYWIYAMLAYGLEFALAYVWLNTVFDIRDRDRKRGLLAGTPAPARRKSFDDDDFDDTGASVVSPDDRQHALKVYGTDAARQLRGHSDV